MSKEDPIRMFDRVNKLYVKIKLSQDKKHWERWISKTKRKWEMTHSSLSLPDVLKFQEEVVRNNYKNFYNLIFKK
jgi:hypothetical protein